MSRELGKRFGQLALSRQQIPASLRGSSSTADGGDDGQPSLEDERKRLIKETCNLEQHANVCLHKGSPKKVPSPPNIWWHHGDEGVWRWGEEMEKKEEERRGDPMNLEAKIEFWTSKKIEKTAEGKEALKQLSLNQFTKAWSKKLRARFPEDYDPNYKKE